MFKRHLATSVIVAASAILAACNSDEVGPGDEHDPVAVTLFVVGGAELTPNVTLQAGQTVRVEARFLDDEGDVIPGLEDEHFAKFTFAPPTLATVAAVAGRTFAFDVTAQTAAGMGTLTVDWGHDAEADERSFGPIAVTVQ